METVVADVSGALLEELIDDTDSREIVIGLMANFAAPGRVQVAAFNSSF